MNPLKQLRNQYGHTQKSLAKATGLSLRTIQRIETGHKPPKGHTLKVLSDTLAIEPSLLSNQLSSESHSHGSNLQESVCISEYDLQHLKKMNLSVLAFFIIPYGNIIGPLWIWRQEKTSKAVNEAGRKIINIQILWMLNLMVLLVIAPFVDITPAGSTPLILRVLIIAIIANISIVIFTSKSINNNDLDRLNLPIRLP